jgi:hypothetical protein
MNITDIIDELITELCLLHNDGLPNLKSKESISFMYEFFNDIGAGDVGMQIIKNITEGESDEEEKHFKNPDLNKIVKYTDVNGEDVEGKVGNLIRRSKEEDAYKKSVATLGGEDGDRYKKAMDDLGSEGQPDGNIGQSGGESTDGGGFGQPKPVNAFDSDTKGGEVYLKSLPDGDPAKPDELKNKTDESRILAIYELLR